MKKAPAINQLKRSRDSFKESVTSALSTQDYQNGGEKRSEFNISANSEYRADNDLISNAPTRPSKQDSSTFENRNSLKTQIRKVEDKDGFVVPTLIPKHQNSFTPSQVSELKKASELDSKELLLQEEKDLVDRSFLVIPVAATLLPTPINSLSHTKDMRWVLLGSDDGYIRKYDFYASINGKLPLTQAHRHATVDVFSRSGVMLSYWDNEVYCDESKTRPIPESGAAFDNSFSPVPSLYLHSRGLWCLSGLNNGDINLYSVRHEEGRCHFAFRKHTAPVSVIEATQSEKEVFSGSWDKKVLLWDLNTGGCVQELIKHKNQICSISVQPDGGGKLLSSSVDGRSCLWDVRKKYAFVSEITCPRDCPPWATSSCWDYSGNKIFTGRRNHVVDCFDVRMQKVERTLKLPPNSGPVSRVLSHPSKNFLLCGSFDNLRMWNLDLQLDSCDGDDPDTISPYQLIPGHQTGTISQMSIDSSGRFLTTASGNRGWEGLATNTALFYEIKYTK